MRKRYQWKRIIKSKTLHKTINKIIKKKRIKKKIRKIKNKIIKKTYKAAGAIAVFKFTKFYPMA